MIFLIPLGLALGAKAGAFGAGTLQVVLAALQLLVEFFFAAFATVLTFKVANPALIVVLFDIVL